MTLNMMPYFYRVHTRTMRNAATVHSTDFVLHGPRASTLLFCSLFLFLSFFFFLFLVPFFSFHITHFDHSPKKNNNPTRKRHQYPQYVSILHADTLFSYFQPTSTDHFYLSCSCDLLYLFPFVPRFFFSLVALARSSTSSTTQGTPSKVQSLARRYSALAKQAAGEGPFVPQNNIPKTTGPGKIAAAKGKFSGVAAPAAASAAAISTASAASTPLTKTVEESVQEPQEIQEEEEAKNIEEEIESTLQVSDLVEGTQAIELSHEEPVHVQEPEEEQEQEQEQQQEQGQEQAQEQTIESTVVEAEHEDVSVEAEKVEKEDEVVVVEAESKKEEESSIETVTAEKEQSSAEETSIPEKTVEVNQEIVEEEEEEVKKPVIEETKVAQAEVADA